MLLALLLPPAAWASTWQVDASGGGTFTSIQPALDSARDGDTVLVAEGDYYGDLDFRGLEVEVRATGDAADTVIEGTVSFTHGEGSGAVLAGFTVRDAIYVQGASPTLEDLALEGGADGSLLSIDGGAPAVSDSSFSGGEADYGGGVFLTSGGLTLTRCTLSNNRAEYAGGALYAASGAWVQLTDTDVVENRVSRGDGAGLYLAGSNTLEIEGGAFSDNQLDTYETDGEGGALWLGSGGDAAVSGATFQENLAYQGGAVATRGSIAFSDTSVTENSAWYGGGVWGVEGASVAATGSDFSVNDAYYYGGAFYLAADFSLTLESSSVEANLNTYGYGAGIYAYDTGSLTLRDVSLQDNVSYSNGGAIWANYLYGAVTLDGVTARGNETTYGSGGVVYGYYYTQVLIEDSLFEDNSAYSFGGVVYNAVYGGIEATGSRFEGNRATLRSGGALAAVPYHSYQDVVSVVDCEFEDNSAVEEGGAVYARYPYSLTVLDSSFVDNRASGTVSFGGALFGTLFGPLEVRRVLFSGNDARYGGAGYFSRHSGDDYQRSWSNLTFQENRAETGGALCMAELTASAELMEVRNSTFVGNQATDAGGAISLYAAYLDFRNNLVAWTAEGAALHAYDLNSRAYSRFEYNDWYENADGDASGEISGEELRGEGSLQADPGLVGWSWDGDPWDDALVPTMDSPLRDAGDPGLLDPDGSVSDIGATGGPYALAEDRDGDGYDTTADCDDGDPDVYPGAGDDWYDGVDSDCGGGSDYDRDGDGEDSADYGGEDCDDGDASVGAEDCGGEDTGGGDDGGGDDGGDDGGSDGDPQDSGDDGAVDSADPGDQGSAYPPPAEDSKGCGGRPTGCTSPGGASPGGGLGSAGAGLLVGLLALARRRRADG
jgi:hypothetical protein